MFYSQFILAKKGPLGTIWIAAHLERKLRKNQVADTDIGVSVDSILFPDIPIALRLSSHLLLGVVRIYSRKVNYLFDDCSEALLKIKQAFRSTAVDLLPEESTAPYHSITLPETFDLDDFELPDNDIFQGNYVDHHVSSRDQITLQDTMDGVVYSTSQFGLDERFGDGDTSGLDLDEELFMNKVAVAERDGVMLNSGADPQASVQSMTSLKQDENHEMIAISENMLATGNEIRLEDNDGDTDFIDYAQAPCTPGLLEEPNLSNVQETSACDDHLESENHSLTEFAMKENLENDSSKSDLYLGNKNEVDGSLLSDVNPDTVLSMPAEENDCLASDLESNRANQQGESAPTAVAMDKTFAASDIPDRVEDLQNGIVGNNEPFIHSDDKTHEDGVELHGPRLGETTTGVSSLNSTYQPVSEDVSENNQASLKMELSNNVEIAGDLANSCPLSNALQSNGESHSIPELEKPETEDTEEPKDSNILDPSVHEKVELTNVHVLRPCVTHLNQLDTLNPGGDQSVPDLPSEVAGSCSLETSERKEDPSALGASTVVRGEGVASKQVLEGNHITALISSKDIQVAYSKSHNQVENVISGDSQLHNLNSYVGSDLPTPEKLLSVPEGGEPNNLLVVATPDQLLARTDGGVDASLIFSGKKRSFTESTLTMQSINSVDSSGVLRTKRTPESVPEDGDLLSSILVGRRSSVLKVKATPRPEITSLKRHRSAPQTSVSKRKVLMDDTMVLHGDMIRQQLTNTEDIRRLRKKAPCTRPEILMIQKQFLEDEIFSETILTGVSVELASLHNQTYDLSETTVCKNNVNDASSGGTRDLRLTSQNDDTGTYLEAANDIDIFVGPDFARETGIGGSSDLIEVGDNGETKAVETPVLMERQQCEDLAIGLDPTIDISEAKSSQEEFLGKTAAMEIDGKNILDVDVVNPDVTVGVHSSFAADAVRDDTCDMSAGIIQLASSEKTSEPDASLQINAPGVSADQHLDMLSVEIDANEDAEKKDDDISAVVIESRTTTNEVSLKETKGGASFEIGIDIQIECLAHTESVYPSTMFSPEIGECSTQVVTFDQAMEEVRQNKQAVVKGDSILDAGVEYNGKNLVSDGVCGEELIIDSSNPEEFNVNLRHVFLDDGENSFRQEASQLNTMDAGISAIDRDDRDDFDYSAVGHNTEFLNYDDDEVAEADDECMPNAEETRFIENSGWSSRTRAVAKYLQTLFDKEADRGKKVLPINNLLAGKSRKEASRMFFEALVLKTKDYIHVEQETPFNNINILPRAKLTKSDF